MPNHSLPRRTMLAGEELRWKKARDGQISTQNKFIKSLTVSLSRVGGCRLLGWSPHDNLDQWLETLGGMVQNWSQ